MKLELILIATSLLVTVAMKPRQLVSDGKLSSQSKEMYFEQVIGHLNYINTSTWQQRYFIEDKYFKGLGGPLFFYTGNEGPIEEFMDNAGYMLTLAQEFNALVVFAEHRFYGKSLPFGDQSFTRNNIKFLSAEQALGDYAVLIQWLKTQHSITKVISFGGSYGGMLSAWFRFKYPNVIDGALAASAPIYMVAGLIPKTAFFQKVTEDFAAANIRCPIIVREAFSEISRQTAQGESGLQRLSKAFSLCKPLTADKVHHLVGWVRNSFTSLAMVDYPYPANFLAPLPAYPVSFSCSILINTPDKLVGLAQAAGLFYNGTGSGVRCFDIDEEFIECADPTGCGTGPAATAWDYQACTEMSLPSESNNISDMFPPSTFDKSDYCLKKWGVTQRPGWMDTQFWGKDIQAASNIIFSNGNLDPWSVGGVQKTLPNDLVAIMIEGGAHHLDLRPPNPKDPQSVIDARMQEKNLIAKWLQ